MIVCSDPDNCPPYGEHYAHHQSGRVPSRRLVWFSCGAASAVAAKLDLAEHGDAVTVAYVDPGSEHPDNVRFLADVEAWLGVPVMRLRSDRYGDTWDVWERTGYLVGVGGARCTAELKKRPRYAVERDYDVQVFGYTADERHRADRFRQQNPDVRLATPLIERGLTKGDCLAMVERAGLVLPVMYQLGYENNNCIGCPKGGMGYWNKLRRDFPDVFDRMALLERRIGHSVNKDETGPVYLDELDPTRGRYSDEPNIDCSLLCAMAEDELTAPARTPTAPSAESGASA